MIKDCSGLAQAGDREWQANLGSLLTFPPLSLALNYWWDLITGDEAKPSAGFASSQALFPILSNLQIRRWHAQDGFPVLTSHCSSQKGLGSSPASQSASTLVRWHLLYVTTTAHIPCRLYKYALNINKEPSFGASEQAHYLLLCSMILHPPELGIVFALAAWLKGSSSWS
jgi:hypothetical protein